MRVACFLFTSMFEWDLDVVYCQSYLVKLANMTFGMRVICSVSCSKPVYLIKY